MHFCQGTNWESAAYEVHRFSTEDEVTALDVSDRHIAVQYHAEPAIDVFDRESKERLFRLEGGKINLQGSSGGLQQTFVDSNIVVPLTAQFHWGWH